jgi:hypothetical protein
LECVALLFHRALAPFGLGEGANFVAVHKVDEPDAFGSPAREPRLLGLDADDLVLPLLASRKDVVLVVADRDHADDLAFLGQGYPSDAGRLNNALLTALFQSSIIGP